LGVQQKLKKLAPKRASFGLVRKEFQTWSTPW